MPSVAAYANDAASSLHACAMRVTRLNADGSIGSTSAPTPNGMYVTDKLTKIVFKPVLETGDEFVVKNGCGGLALSYKAPDTLKRLDVEVDLQTMDPELVEMMTGGTVLTAGGSSVGFKPIAVGANPGNGVAIEFWTEAYLVGGKPSTPAASVITDGATTSASAVVTSAAQGLFSFLDKGAAVSGAGIPAATTILSVQSATQITLSANATATASGVTLTIQRAALPYWRFAIPKVQLAFSDATAENAPFLTVLTGPSSENSGFGNGPLDDWPAGYVDKAFAYIRDKTIPTAQVGYQSIPQQA